MKENCKMWKLSQEQLPAFHHSCCYFFLNRETGRRHRGRHSRRRNPFNPCLPFRSLGEAGLNSGAHLVLVNLKISSSSSVSVDADRAFFFFFQKHDLTRIIFLNSAVFQKEHMPPLSNGPVYLVSQQIPCLIQRGKNVTLSTTGL